LNALPQGEMFVLNTLVIVALLLWEFSFACDTMAGMLGLRQLPSA
jgi:hypothetical protein